MAGFNEWFMTGLQNGITDIADFLGIGTQRRQNEFNAQEAEKQRQWETEMSNTAYQRQAADMEKAGVNSAMAFSNGGATGASTPSGAAAHTSANSGQASSLLNGIANVMNANTAQFKADRYNKHLDYKEKERLDVTTNEIYSGAGELIKTILTSKLHSK